MSRGTRAARRADRSGSGPTVSDAPVARNPGALSWFGLLGEVLLVGILVSVVSLPVLTLPAALAAGVRHLGRYVRAESSSLEAFWRDVWKALPGGIAVGAAALVAGLLLAFDLVLATSGALPGGWLVGAAGIAVGTLLAVGLLVAAGAWHPRTGWTFALRTAPRRIVRDPAGALYLLATIGFAVAVTWQLFPLIVPALGCVCLAMFAVPQRPARRRRRAG